MDTKDLIAERANVWNRMKELLDRASSEERPLSAEEELEWQRLDARIEQLDTLIERAQAPGARAGIAPGLLPQPGDHTRDETVSQEAREKEYREAFVNWVRDPLALSVEQRRLLQQGHVQLGDAERRFLGTTVPATAGYLVPKEFERQLVNVLLDDPGPLQVVDVMETPTGNEIIIPRLIDDTEAASWYAEGSPIQSASDGVSFDQVSLRAYILGAGPIDIHQSLLTDAGIDSLESEIRAVLGRRMAIAINTALTTGTGTNQPQGLLTAAPVGYTTPAGQTTTIGYDDLIEAVHMVHPRYRVGARWMFNDTVLKMVRKLKDSTGQPIWQPGLVSGEPNTLLGYPYTINAYMPNPDAGTKPILFGNFGREFYRVRRVSGISGIRLEGDDRKVKLVIGLFAVTRMDARLVVPNAIKAVQMASA